MMKKEGASVRFKSLGALLIAASAVLGSTTAWAQADRYPTRPIRLIVPAAPGGAIDVAGRVFATEMSKTLGQPIFVDNRVGATGLIGTQAVQAAAPDGLTLLYTSSSAQVVSGLLRTPPPYDAVTDFTPIGMTFRYPIYIVGHPSVPAKTIQEFVAYAKKNPGKLNFGSVGGGSVGHLACELFADAAGIDIVHVPYKSGAAATNGIVAGEVQLMCDSVANSQPFVKDGRLVGLAVMAKTRSQQVPEVPTTAEAGWPGVEAYVWHGLFAPARLPEGMARQLATALDHARKLESVRERARAQGMDLSNDTPASFSQAIASERDVWSKVIKSKGIVAQQ